MLFLSAHRVRVGVLCCLWLLGALSGPQRVAAQESSEEEDATKVANPDGLEATDGPADEPETPTSPDEAPDEAVDLYQRGREAYQAGRYEEAIGLLKGALALDPGSPTLMYNVAKVSELLGNLDEAIHYYESYLSALPESDQEERSRIREALHRLRGAQESTALRERTTPEAAPAQLEAPPPTSVSDEPSMGRADSLFWITGGTGALLVLGGTVAGVLALEGQGSANSFVLGQDGSADDLQSKRDSAENLALAADVMLVTGVAALTGAALLYFLREEERSPVSAGPSLGGLYVRGLF